MRVDAYATATCLEEILSREPRWGNSLFTRMRVLFSTTHEINVHAHALVHIIKHTKSQQEATPPWLQAAQLARAAYMASFAVGVRFFILTILKSSKRIRNTHFIGSILFLFDVNIF